MIVKKTFILAIFPLSLLIFSIGCSFQGRQLAETEQEYGTGMVETVEQEQEPVGEESIDEQAVMEPEDNAFDARQVQEGDMIGSFIIQSIETGPSGYPPDEDKYSATVKFRGETVVERKYINNSSHEFLGDE